MTSTRESVLKTLLTRPRCTIQELGEAVGINDISVRHHINSLLAEGLASSDEERHGVGRPRRVYFLTEAGLERFPTRYLRLTVRLLEQLKETMPPNLVNQLFNQMAEGLAQDYTSQANLKNMTMEQRLDAMKEMLAKEGFSIEWERQGDQYHIHEASCPYYHVGQNHPEVCTVDKALISAVLSVPAQKTRCILNGDSSCTYVISGSQEKPV